MKIRVVYCLFMLLLFQPLFHAEKESNLQDWESFAKGEKRINKNSNGIHKTVGTIGWVLHMCISVMIRFFAEGLLFVTGMTISVFLTFKCLNCYSRKSGRKNK